MTTSSIVETVASRNPAKMAGIASGSRTCMNTRVGDMPIPTAASIASTGTPSRPVRMLRTKMTREYIASGITTVQRLSPKIGKNATIAASEGTAYSAVESPRTPARSVPERRPRTARGNATAKPIATESTVKMTCSRAAASIVDALLVT
jgi:hypothetical protein